MNPRVKLHLWRAAYCALLASLNWFRTVEYSRTVGITSERDAPVGLACLLSGVVVLYLAFHCMRHARSRLESGMKVSPGRWIQSRAVVFYALPLLWHEQTTSTWKEADGALATVTRGYGDPLSIWVFCFAVIGLLLFQILVRLSSESDEPSGQASAIVVG